MLPPLPPSPPEGPPRGTYFSRRKAMQPLPPLPAFTNILASSTNTGKGLQKKDNISELPKSGMPERRPLPDATPTEASCFASRDPRGRGDCRLVRALLPANAASRDDPACSRRACDLHHSRVRRLLGGNRKNVQQLFLRLDGREHPGKASRGRPADRHRELKPLRRRNSRLPFRDLVAA